MDSEYGGNRNRDGNAVELNGFKVYSNVNPSTFQEVFWLHKSHLENGELVDFHEYKGAYDDCKCFLSSDGLQGFAIEPDGNIISVYNANAGLENPHAQKGWTKTLVKLATENGGDRLDCYDSQKQPLAEIYAKYGFKTVSRMPYNMEYDHDNIAANHNKPDVVFMAHIDKDIEVKNFTKDEYNEAERYRNEIIENDISNLRKKYNSFHSELGGEDEIYVGDKTIEGQWKLVEAEAPSASHDEQTFNKTRGFPTNADGSTINDRDYQNDKAAQLAVISIANKYDGRALSFDTPVVVTKDGVVVSGNNRTMSSKLAAKNGTDSAYIRALKKRASRFGLNPDDIKNFKHPRVVFEIDNQGSYSTDEFAQYNVSETKQMNPVEQAVKVSKIVKPDTVKSVASRISNYDTIGELYANTKEASDIFDVFERDGIINKFSRPQYITENGITGAGKEFLETVLIGSVINENNIRGLTREGCKSIRRKLVRAIMPLVNNKTLGSYSVNKELNEAVDIVMQVQLEKKRFKNVEEFSKQQNFFEKTDKVVFEFAKRLEGTEKGFAEFMNELDGSLQISANGEADIFLGGVETKDQILERVLSIKKSLNEWLKRFLKKIA